MPILWYNNSLDECKPASQSFSKPATAYAPIIGDWLAEEEKSRKF